MKSYDLGIAGEESAAIYLEKHGYEIISRRTRIGHSEIDITARDTRDGTVVFVEVKTRRMNPSGAGFYSTAGSAVDEKKQAYLVRAAEEYMRRTLDIVHTENSVRKQGKFSMKKNRY